MTSPVEVALSIRAEHAEGPLWDAATARLWWVDITGQRVHCSDPASGNDSSWATAGQPGGVVLGAAGEPVVASPEGLAVLDRSTGTMDLRVPVEQDRPGNRANDVKTDSTGRAWVGTMAYDKRPRDAALYRVDGGTGDLRGRAPDDLQRARLRRTGAGALPGRYRPVRRRRSSAWTPRRAPSLAAAVSSTSVRRRSGRTA